jgi:site-specific DNA-methyltransferase (adenine-specific)/adenine-specific DNA-methyltransferase
MTDPNLPDVPLNDQEISQVAERLRAGEFLDQHLLPRLFSRPREAELNYASKMSRGDILSQTLAVPLQTTKRFGSTAEAGWSNKLVCGENLQVLKTLLEMKRRGELENPDGSHGFRLCYIDPPFATRRDFVGSQGQPAYRDKVEGAEFIEFLRKRLIFIHELLAPDGTLYVHLDPKKGHYVKVILDEVFSGNFRNEIIWWYYNKFQGNVNRLPANHDCIYVYSKTGTPLFNELVEEREESSRLLKRAWSSEKQRLVNVRGPDGKLLYIEKDDKRIDDVWRLSMLQPADRTEVVDYPTQKPLTLLSLIIEASSAPGDLVLDCFVGSGTTAEAAERLGRRWIAVDSGKLAIYTTQRRLLTMREGTGRDRKRVGHRPFEICAAGLYDNQLLENQDFTDYESFCLELFGCQPDHFDVAGVSMSGTRKGDPVHFFPWNETDLVLGLEYLESLHERVAKLLTGSLYVVVPDSRCDPGLFVSLVTFEQLTIFILRVPYSVIEALHDRAFSLIDQPASLSDVNDALDAYGFDFVQPPDVGARFWRSKGKITGRIDTFARGGLDPDDFTELPNYGRADLAMVMIDPRYNGSWFNLHHHYEGKELTSHHWFAESLEEAGWSFSLPEKVFGAEFMVIYVDAHGNERAEVVTVDSLPQRQPAVRSGKRVNKRRSIKPDPTTRASSQKAAGKQSARRNSRTVGK